MAYVYAQHAHYMLLFLVLVVNSGFKFTWLQATHFYVLLCEVEVCMAADMLTGTLLIGFD